MRDGLARRMSGLAFLTLALVAATSIMPQQAKARRLDDDPWLGYPWVFVNIQVVDRNGMPVSGAKVSYSYDNMGIPAVGTLDDTDGSGWTTDGRTYDRKMTYTAKAGGKSASWTGQIWTAMVFPSPAAMGEAYIQIELDIDVSDPMGGMEAIIEERFFAPRY